MSKETVPSTFAASRQRSANSCTISFTEAERNRILDHLAEIVQSPVFRNSKRDCALLRYVVERAAEGQADQLKERTIGVDAFGRQADYDTNADHSVRSAAGEVRRRLAQYYMESGPDPGIRIELLPGSYVPQIRFTERPGQELVSRIVPVASSHSVFKSGPRRIGRWRLERVAVMAGIAALVAAGLGFAAAWRQPTAFDQLWNPILSSPNTALLCFGGGQAAVAEEAPVTVADFERLPARNMNVSDALALVAVTGTLGAKGKAFRVLNRANTTSFKDLQQGPFILIGALNNEWTLRLTAGLRFTFERRAPGQGSRIRDKKNPDDASWTFRYSAPFAEVMRDYAVVTRVRDPKTEQTALVVAGLGSWGTQAAAEFVTNPSYLGKLQRLAPRNWQQKNLQVVIATDIIRGSSGPPAILAAEFW